MRNILILGKSAKEFALAKQLSETYKVYVLPGSVAMEEFATIVDSQIDDVHKIVEFVLENDISLTIVADEAFVSQELMETYQNNDLQIFTPNPSFIDLIKDKVAVKKFLYRLRIQTPRFASFDKANVAYDYIKNARFPLLLKSNLGEYATICVNEKIAKTAVDDLVLRDEQILIEEYIHGQTFTAYFVSDGYKALPIGTAQNYNFALDGDGGVLTNGIGSCSPFYKLTDAHIDYLTSSVATPIIESFEHQGSPVCAIFGVEAILTSDDSIYISNLKNFVSDADAQGILALLDIDLVKVIDDCLLGTFADIYDYIPQKDLYALSSVLSARVDEEVISGVKNLDENTRFSYYVATKNRYLELLTRKGKVLNVTTCAGTISRARDLLYSEIEEIDFKTKSYRKDIGALIAGNRGLL